MPYPQLQLSGQPALSVAIFFTGPRGFFYPKPASFF